MNAIRSVIKFVRLPNNTHNDNNSNGNDNDNNNNDQKEDPNSYRLLRFVDGRDERYTHLIDNDRPIKSTTNTYEIATTPPYNWCKPNPNNQSRRGHIVLYIPGHEGKYEQSRSIGAHGIQMTTEFISDRDMIHLKKALKNGTMRGG